MVHKHKHHVTDILLGNFKLCESDVWQNIDTFIALYNHYIAIYVANYFPET